MRFTIKIKDEDKQVTEVIHDQKYFCTNSRTSEPQVVKHTSEHLEYHAYYELCIEAEDIRRKELLVELFMGERMNPLVYQNGEGQPPLVEVGELIEVE